MGPEVESFRYCCRYGKKGCKKWCYSPACAEEKPVLVDDHVDKRKFVTEPDFKPETDDGWKYCCRTNRSGKCTKMCSETFAEEKPVLVDDVVSKKKFVSESDFEPEVERFSYCCRRDRNGRCTKTCFEPTFSEEKPVLTDDDVSKMKFVSEPDFKP